MKKSIFLTKIFRFKKKDYLYDNINIKKDFFLFESNKKKYVSLYYKFCNLILNEKKINKNFVKKNCKKFLNMKGINLCYFSYEGSSFFKKNNFSNLLSKIIFFKSFKKIIFDKTNFNITFYFKIKNTKEEIKKSLIEIRRFLKKNKKYYKKYKKKNFLFKLNKKYNENFYKIKRLINIGEIMQVQLSNKFFIKKKINKIEIYKKLLRYCNKEQIYFFSYKKKYLIINSPETFLKNYSFLEMFPIAGTMKRGINIITDKILERKLIKDSKENSEHNMLIDMTRNDLSSIRDNIFNKEIISCKKIEKFFFVQHIVSKIKTKRNDDFLKSIFKTFPSGTLTGAPKIKAMKIIKKIENFCREFYGGVIGFYKKNFFDLTIIIRTILIKKNKVFIHAASGIVKNSLINKEKKEIENKIKNITNVVSLL
ncbi:Anthranilate synthase, aminase component [Candidatus Vidania fulgoroideae]|uniref:Anthranilate synthase, aminase component n=1 Tax=Candidatus Vidania fulgoroideorum TaxID=881286 RepID=A0A346E0E9_9PROT|nr:Anthranilate synthase, aminase component [Candidatus Vidania fulgoroideae]